MLFLCQFLPFVFFLQDLVSIFGTAPLADRQILAKRIFFDHETLLQSFLHDSLAEQRLFGQVLFVGSLGGLLVFGGLGSSRNRRFVLHLVVSSSCILTWLVGRLLVPGVQLKTARGD